MNDKIIAIVTSGNTQKDLSRVIETLREFKETDLFNSLFILSIQKQEIGKGVAFAAYSLNELNPASQISVQEAVRALLKNWDISLKEVVLYLVKQFGKDKVLKETRTLKTTLREGEELVRVKTIEYWLMSPGA